MSNKVVASYGQFAGKLRTRLRNHLNQKYGAGTYTVVSVPGHAGRNSLFVAAYRTADLPAGFNANHPTQAHLNAARPVLSFNMHGRIGTTSNFHVHESMRGDATALSGIVYDVLRRHVPVHTSVVAEKITQAELQRIVRAEAANSGYDNRVRIVPKRKEVKVMRGQLKGEYDGVVLEGVEARVPVWEFDVTHPDVRGKVVYSYDPGKREHFFQGISLPRNMPAGGPNPLAFAHNLQQGMIAAFGEGHTFTADLKAKEEKPKETEEKESAKAQRQAHTEMQRHMQEVVVQAVEFLRTFPGVARTADFGLKTSAVVRAPSGSAHTVRINGTAVPWLDCSWVRKGDAHTIKATVDASALPTGLTPGVARRVAERMMHLLESKIPIHYENARVRRA